MNTLETSPATATATSRVASEAPRKTRTGVRVVHRTATALFAVIMTASGTAFVLGPEPIVDGIHRLGYPPYFIPLLGAAKLLGVVTLLVPGTRALRDWAYAGFTFLLTGAILSHVVSGDTIAHAFPAVLTLGLLLTSYALRSRMGDLRTGVPRLATSSSSAKGFWRIAPWVARLALVPPVFIFTAIAVRSLSDPVGSSAALGIALSTPQAITTARIGFGAFPLGFTAVLATCLLSRRRVLMGLGLAATVTAVVTIVRALGIALDGTAEQSVKLLHAEIGLMVVLLAGLGIELARRLRQP